MVFVNLKLTNRKIAAVLLIFTAVVVLAVALRLETFSMTDDEGIKCTDEAAVREYLHSFGLEPSEVTVDEIIVPHEFNDVYENYNDIQRSQGFDLSDYKGKVLQRYTFKINGHPNGGHYFAEVLLFNKTVVGADIYSTEIDGSISPLK